MAAHHPRELDSGTDSVSSTPRSYHSAHNQPRVRFMCSFGGKILPRPHDNQLRYVGGDTRIVAVNRTTTFSALLSKLSKLTGTADISIKYQMLNEDLDALITIATDEDVENMMEELERQNNKTARLRLFLFSNTNNGDESRASSISSLLDGSSKRESWFLDALNSGGDNGGLERGRSEASSIASELPDYLLGLDNPDDAHQPNSKSAQFLPETARSDPGSPALAMSSPFGSTSSASGVQPVKTAPELHGPIMDQKETPTYRLTEMEHPTGFTGTPIWSHHPGAQYQGRPIQSMPIPVYYVSGQGPVPHIQQMPIQGPYIHPYQVPSGHVRVGYNQVVPGSNPVYGRPSRPVAMDPYDIQTRVVSGGANQQTYYVINGGAIPNEMPGSGPDDNTGRIAKTRNVLDF
ncbi:hypothetical protein Nepgr_007221 [Nepenthes gracilis]|uniref:PB1 domain-containing protein n=1 Tax=Nepenthes gracilis TaxID=150966 RepID=A0AAD3S6R6_NEPGR|nr:hypothetical protein Nepgr_007221 [Nepenthes gracilis]